jgi:nucleoside-diphosphate-sugar epimerase
LAKGVPVRAVDKKPVDEWYFQSSNAENLVADLQLVESCDRVIKGVAHVYNLAADMGGMGFIENNKALCMLSVLINTHMLIAAQKHGVDRFFYSSSACVYPGYKQTDADVVALKESDAYPADAEDGYGWEKLFGERLCRHFREDLGIKTRVARYHNVYGPYGTWDGGREKAPAAVSRKVAMAVIAGKHEIEIWGDGEQTRSFMYIDDCLIGTQKLLHSDIEEPLNIGSDEMVTINQLVDIVEEIAGVKLQRNYRLDAPKGVRGRNSDNTLVKAKLGWAPSIPLRTGMEETYRWIYDQAKAREEGRPYIAAAA